MKVVKVLNGAVQLEDGRVRNLQHVSLFKASNLPQKSVSDDLDEESGYLWGYEDVRSGGVEGGGESRNRENDTIPIRKKGKMMWCVDRMWSVIDIRSTTRDRGVQEVEVGNGAVPTLLL
ncbi:hypothetical protein NDU88_007619 [Pleurodeles waltl]|uniref:Uncharacterized protein n=1 Tax=Pleurodeles waltl TaxID=8319 RepID=A0AAV7U209_PLEWA|nr:hypothetical protein NDU88_007619 [Pleurodeles waltl]